MSGISWRTGVGINNVGSYQVAGAPFASGNLDATSGTPLKIEFPYVTSWFTIINHDETNELTCSFSEAGLTNGNFFHVHPAPTDNKGTAYMPVFDLKVTELWFTGSAPFDIVAGLTNIQTASAYTEFGPSWSGSVGVG